ncbi:WXG100 family type VII secretion target [Nocardia panacis]|nr:WXG100 family type VII secretion target [Nocardia panacis]
MADELSANFTDMQVSARQLADWHGDSTQVFEAGHAEISSAASGWVGNSQAALHTALAKMRGSASRLTGRLDDHSADIAAGSGEYHDVDHGSGENITRSGRTHLKI